MKPIPEHVAAQPPDARVTATVGHLRSATPPASVVSVLPPKPAQKTASVNRDKFVIPPPESVAPIVSVVKKIPIAPVERNATQSDVSAQPYVPPIVTVTADNPVKAGCANASLSLAQPTEIAVAPVVGLATQPANSANQDPL